MISQITVCTSTCIFVRIFSANMVADIDWCSHTTQDWIWLVSCFGPSRQYFSLYRAVCQRRRQKREKIVSKQPHPHLLQAQKAFALLLSKLVESPGTESLHSIIAPSLRLDCGDSFSLSLSRRVAQSVGHLTRRSEVLGSGHILSFLPPLIQEGQLSVTGELVNRLGGLSLPRKSVVRLTGRPDMTLDVYVDVKQQHDNNNNFSENNKQFGFTLVSRRFNKTTFFHKLKQNK